LWTCYWLASMRRTISRLLLAAALLGGQLLASEVPCPQAVTGAQDLEALYAEADTEAENKTSLTPEEANYIRAREDLHPRLREDYVLNVYKRKVETLRRQLDGKLRKQ